MKIDYNNLQNYEYSDLKTKLRALNRLKSITANKIYRITLLEANIRMYKYRKLSKDIKTELNSRLSRAYGGK